MGGVIAAGFLAACEQKVGEKRRERNFRVTAASDVGSGLAEK